MHKIKNTSGTGKLLNRLSSILNKISITGNNRFYGWRLGVKVMTTDGRLDRGGVEIQRARRLSILFTRADETRREEQRNETTSDKFVAAKIMTLTTN